MRNHEPCAKALGNNNNFLSLGLQSLSTYCVCCLRMSREAILAIRVIISITIDNKYTGWETFVIPEGTMRVVLQRLPVYV